MDNDNRFTVFDAKGIRVELFKLFYLKEEYVLNSKADAYEALDTILSIIHAWQVYLGNREDKKTLQMGRTELERQLCHGSSCFVHDKFYIDHRSIDKCICG